MVWSPGQATDGAGCDKKNTATDKNPEQQSALRSSRSVKGETSRWDTEEQGKAGAMRNGMDKSQRERESERRDEACQNRAHVAKTKTKNGKKKDTKMI